MSLRKNIERVEKLIDPWTPDHSLWFVAWLIQEFGPSAVCNLQEDLLTEAGKKPMPRGRGPKITPDEASARLGTMFTPPGFVVDTPFPDTLEMWWGSVAQVMRAGKIVGEGGKPNYKLVMRGWKNQVLDKYGFRPQRTDDQTMTDQIRHMASGAAKVVASKKAGSNFPPEVMAQAGKLLRGKRLQKQRQKEFQKATNKGVPKYQFGMLRRPIPVI